MLKLLVKNAIFVLTLLAVTTLLRFYFFMKTSALYEGYQTDLMLISFVHGLRFDLSALIYLNCGFIFLIYFNFFRKSKTFHLIFAFLNALMVGVSVADTEFYLSYGKKMSPSFFSKIRGTGFETLSSMIYAHGFIILVLVLSLFFFYRLTRSLYKKKEGSLRVYPLYFLICIAVGLLGIRGGFQKRVLGKTHIHLYAGGKAWASELTSNTVHNLIRRKYRNFFPGENFEKRMKIELSPRVKLRPLDLNKTPKNIVIIFVESMSSYIVDQEGLLDFDFLKENPDSSLFVNDTYANGRHSIDALMATFFGVPSYFDVDIVESKYLGNKWVGMPTVLSKHNFSSVFLHAARGGTQYFDSATNIAGFQKYRSILDEYNPPEEMRGLWGVHDDFMYDKSIEILDTYESPFLATIFTTSSHMPFVGTPLNPSSLGTKELDYAAAVNYADQSLERFFEKAKKTKWYEDSLFVILADHNPPMQTSWSKDPSLDSKIPLVFYLPGSNIGKLPIKKVSQQVDLPMSIFQILDIEPEIWSPYGASVFDLEAKSPVFYTGGGAGRELTLISKDGVIKTKPANIKAKDKALIKIESLIHDYIYRLENDQVYSD